MQNNILWNYSAVKRNSKKTSNYQWIQWLFPRVRNSFCIYESAREREKEWEREKECEKESVCVCVCARERERKRERDEECKQEGHRKKALFQDEGVVMFIHSCTQCGFVFFSSQKLFSLFSTLQCMSVVSWCRIYKLDKNMFVVCNFMMVKYVVLYLCSSSDQQHWDIPPTTKTIITTKLTHKEKNGHICSATENVNCSKNFVGFVVDVGSSYDQHLNNFDAVFANSQYQRIPTLKHRDQTQEYHCEDLTPRWRWT